MERSVWTVLFKHGGGALIFASAWRFDNTENPTQVYFYWEPGKACSDVQTEAPVAIFEYNTIDRISGGDNEHNWSA